MIKKLYPVVFLFVLAVCSSITATSYFVEPDYFPLGSVVHLFFGGSQEVRKGMAVNDTLTAYRPKETCELQDVGRITVVSFDGRYYLLGKIVDGEIKAGDIVKKGTAACIVIPSGWTCAK
jgi:hypothetical protein